VVNAPILAIERIVVRGNHRLSSGEVVAVLDGLRGANLLRTDLAVWRERLLASPWVREATLRRLLPSTVEVTVSEREPIGIGRLSGDLYLIDRSGMIIDAYGPRHEDFDLPIIDGLAASTAQGARDEEARADLAARVIASLHSSPAVARRLSQVDVTDPSNAAVILEGDPALIYVGNRDFLPRLESYLGLVDTLRSRVREIDSVDLRFENRIYVRPDPRARRGRAAARDRAGAAGAYAAATGR
jgi:cell division septal protein FtsQ